MRTAPDATAPDAAPDATAPDATAPTRRRPMPCPGRHRPDATAGSYSAALATSLIAFSDKPGLSRSSSVATWDNAATSACAGTAARSTKRTIFRWHYVVNHNCVSTLGRRRPDHDSIQRFDRPGTPRKR
jgi:hypothetical protein